jgi:signal transduction histidine kinase
MISGRRRSVIFFTVLGICLVALAVTLNVSWVVLNWRLGVLAVLGVIFFLVLIAGMVFNTIFLVREIRRNEQHDSFINAVTHELKTPVASIRLYLQTLQTRELDDAKRREFYRIMLEDSDRLLNTIEQVLRAGSSGSRLRRIARARVDLGEIARECVELARTRFHLGADALAYEQNVQNVQNMADAGPVVIGDPEELKAAVWNLVDNAVKYSAGDVRIRVALEAFDDQRLAIRVTDRGVGISPAELKRIFRRFYRIPASVAMRTKGSGLGLFIVRSVARKHGGRAFAESDGAGHGSTFTLMLPRAPAPRVDATARSGQAPASL